MPPIADLPHAILHQVSVNEIGFDQKQEGQTGQPSHDDPVALRFGAWANPLGRLKWYLAKISLDVLRWKQGQTHRTEIGFIALKVDELFDGDGLPVPMIEVLLTKDTEGSNDADMVKVVSLTQKAVRFHVPVIGMDAAEAPSLAPNKMQSTDGRWQYEIQNDFGTYPQLVIYDMQATPPKARYTIKATPING